MAADLKTYLRTTSWPIILAMLALMAIGLAAIRQAQPAYAGRQLVFCAVALAAFVAASAVPYQRLGDAAYVLFGLTLAMLVVVLLLPPISNVHRWIDLGLVQVQVSEIAKVAYILMLAWYLRYRDNYRRLSGLAIPFVLTLAPMGLVLIEPDLGTSLLFLPTLYLMLFMAGAKLRHLLGIIAVATVLVLLPAPVERSGHRNLEPLAYGWGSHRVLRAGGREYLLLAAPLVMRVGDREFVQSHQTSRIVGWLNQDDSEVSFQLLRSKLMVGAGGLSGRGQWDEGPEFFRSLPESHTDFIFSVIGGQWGLAGCLAVLGLYGVILVVGVEIAVLTYDAFGRMLAIGVLAMLGSQTVINAGMTLGLLPVTGMTLPLVSYGGSSLVVNAVMLGLLVNVGHYRPILLGPKPFEFGEDQRAAAGPATTARRGWVR